MPDKRSGSFSLRKKILLSLNALVLASLLLVTFVTNYISSRIVLQDSIKHTQDILSLVLTNCYNILEGAVQSSDQLYYDPAVYEILERAESGNTEISAFIDQIRDKMTAIEASSEDVRIFSVIFSSQVITRSYNRLTENIISESRDFVRQAAEKGAGKTVYYILPEMEDYLGISRALYGPDLSSARAVFSVFIPLKSFSTNFRNLLKEYQPYFILIDRKSQDELVKYQESFFDIKSFFSNPDKGDLKNSAVYEDTLLNVLISYKLMENPDWMAVLAVPKKVLFSRLYNLSFIQVLVSLSVLLAVSVIAAFLTRGIVKPLVTLVYKLKEFEESPSRMNLEIKRNDEIGYLYETMNRMSERLDHLINMVYREQITRKDAELKALQAQINPHFLFNTLETISWKARLEGADTASEMITALSMMLHVNIGREGRDILTIRKELNYLDNYFFLQKIRHENMIEFENNVSSGILSYAIPCLSLQPVAENAIFHNTPITRLLKISLRGYRKDGKIYLEFKDNGKGVTDENRKKINEALSKADKFIITDNDRNRKSVGLVNVHRRIQLYYGEEYGITVGENKNGALIIITLPADPDAEKGVTDV